MKSTKCAGPAPMDWPIIAHRWRFACCFAGALLLVGCGQDPNKIPVYQVTGSVNYNGAPMQGAAVALIPSTPIDGVKVPPFGEVDEEGKFAITTFGGSDGAPSGEYKVILTWSDGDPDSPSDLCKGKYSNPKRPIAAVTVVDSATELAPIDLKGPKIKTPTN